MPDMVLIMLRLYCMSFGSMQGKQYCEKGTRLYGFAVMSLCHLQAQFLVILRHGLKFFSFVFKPILHCVRGFHKFSHFIHCLDQPSPSVANPFARRTNKQSQWTRIVDGHGIFTPFVVLIFKFVWLKRVKVMLNKLKGWDMNMFFLFQARIWNRKV